MGTLFEINKLACRYEGASSDALRVESAQINYGDIVFFIGPSGVGKSTVLETLGLMSNTLVGNTKGRLKFFPEKGTGNDIAEDINFYEIWKKSESARSSIRQKYFSFIFQNDNLFDNMSIRDNVMMPMFLQGASKQEADERTQVIFDNLFDETNLDWNDPVKQISGGQRQRVSFARAIAPSFKVIYADEPTGNLDAKNANNLMNLLFDEVQRKKSSAIIVSHDIALAIKYANKIIFIERVANASGSYGYVSDKSVYSLQVKGIWQNLDRNFSSIDLQKELTHKLQNA